MTEGAIVSSFIPLFAILCPATASILILLSRKRPNVRESWTIIAGILQFSLIASMIPTILNEEVIKCIFFQTMFKGIAFGFKVDAFGLIFALTASFLWILVSFYSIGYMRSLREHAQTRYYFCFAIAIFGAIGVAMSANLLTMFIFFEILTVSTYPLVIHEQSKEAISAGHKYFAYLLTAGVFLLFAIMMTYYLTGTTDFTGGGIKALSELSSAYKLTLVILFFCFLLGFMKAAWMPFHSWLPTAMIAPTPVSALLHAVAVVKAGVFGIVRIVCYIYGVDLMTSLGLGLALACIAGFTMIVANLFAIAQDNLKRRLAYSTINQLSYIILGAALLSPKGIEGAMIHIPFHGFMKITLFLCAGAIMVVTGKKNISEMAGVGKQMPVTMLAFTITAFGMCGIPPACGFISKWFLCLGTLQAEEIIFLFVLLIASLLDVVYFFPIIHIAFFKRPEGGVEEVEVKEAPLFMLIPLSLTAIFSVIFFLDFILRLNIISMYFYKIVEIAVGNVIPIP
ncbi:MAG: monovalent cation/H+ antiporter subunit D family protein [Methanophagales archaeon]|nr:monovalent cation/H+ antiporter subunit D family protein [Methanophagales archaeon]MCW3141620.1 monovalent cation/H+ antiporter subunit D family protein [Methanophagales archaeon]